MASQATSKHPTVFGEFFELGLPEEASPFLTPSSRRWGINLTLYSAFLATGLLAIAFLLRLFTDQIPLSNVLLITVYFLVGIPSLIEAIEDMIDLKINIDILMTLAAFSSVLIGSGMEGALLLVLFALSGAMEDAVTSKAKSSLSSLHKLSPTKACVIESDGLLLERSVKDIEVGNLILIKSGEVVPLDGIVVSGISSVNLVHLTGENLPVTKKAGDQVPAGALNQEGALTVQVTLTSSDSTLAKIIQLVVQAQEAKPALQRWFDRFSTRYAMTIILASLFFALTFPWLLNIPFLGTRGSLYRALTFLIAASPCALIIAVPIAYLSAVSVCAKKGILLKGGIVLDALANCSAIAFDKTGTLTLGELTCLGIDPFEPGYSTPIDQVLSIAYALEKNAVHPIAKSIVHHAEGKRIAPAALLSYKSIPGEGLQGEVSLRGIQTSIFIGRPEWILSLIPPHQVELVKKRADAIKDQGELLAVALIGQELFFFRFLDTPRPLIKETLATLKKHSWQLVMLTGDHKNNAKRIASDIGIDHYFADLRPEDKLHHVNAMAQEKGLIMIGDGVNDAPALARATVGIGMGKVGSATAIEAAEVVFLHDNIERLDWLLNKARQTQAIVKQNLTIAFGAIAFAVIPALSGLIPLWLAVIIHEGGTVLVGLNALRLLRK